MDSFVPADKTLFFSKQDSYDPRFGDLSKPITTTQAIKNSIIIAGYPDDEGIRLNKGRPGAALGPDSIRTYFYKMTPNVLSPSKPTPLFDLGNLSTKPDLKQRHDLVRNEIASALKSSNRWIGLGGGHDYGFADGAGFCEQIQKEGQRPLVINFDAHLDVRPDSNGLNSGTPFYRLLKAFPEIDFAEIGIQSQCNSREHFEWCKKQGGKILTWDEIQQSSDTTTAVLNFLEPYLLKRRPCFLSIDIDAFSSSYAMGCSQSWPTGFEPESFFRIFDVLVQRLDVRVLGLYEVSPPLDLDGRTAKLAALMLHHFVSNHRD